jgi:O-antigen/teichoic acid export membrane protein
MISQMRLLLRSPRHVVYRVACKHALLGATMMAGLALAIPFAVPRIYGINIPFSLVVLACVAGVMPFFYGPLILQVQKQTEKMVAYIILIAATCTYLSGAILIPQLQIYGAPLALSVGHIITALLVFCLEKKYHARST